MSATKDCRGVENELALFVGGELGPRARADVEQHLQGCGACSAAVARLADSRSALRAGLDRPAATLPDLWPGVRARLLESGTIRAPFAPASQSASAAPVRRMPRWVRLSAAAALILALGLWLLQLRHGSATLVGPGPDLVSKDSQPLRVQPVGLRRLAAGESALSDSATTIDQLQEEERLRAALQPGGAQAASQHLGIH